MTKESKLIEDWRTAAAAILAISIILIVLFVAFASAASALYEDQYTLCNFKKVCFDFNKDDYLSDSTQEEFELFYSNEMDTYDAEDLVN